MQDEDLELFASAEALDEIEPNEPELSTTEINTLFEAQSDLAEAPAELTESDSGFAMDEFSALIATLGLKHFSPRELLAMGGQHSTPGDRCHGLNRPPPQRLWPNILSTITVLDDLRGTLGKPIAISSAYRNNAYNSCIDGKLRSQHKRYNAIDFVSRDHSALDMALALVRMRNASQFRGGVGVYNTFVHVDTRGVNRTWKGTGTPQSHLDQLLDLSS